MNTKAEVHDARNSRERERVAEFNFTHSFFRPFVRQIVGRRSAEAPCLVPLALRDGDLRVGPLAIDRLVWVQVRGLRQLLVRTLLPDIGLKHRIAAGIGKQVREQLHRRTEAQKSCRVCDRRIKNDLTFVFGSRFICAAC